MRKLKCIVDLHFSWNSGVPWLLQIFCRLSSFQLGLNFLILLMLNPRTYMCTLWFPVGSSLTSSLFVCSCLSIIKIQIREDNNVTVNFYTIVSLNSFDWRTIYFIIHLDAKGHTWESCFVTCIFGKNKLGRKDSYLEHSLVCLNEFMEKRLLPYFIYHFQRIQIN